MDQETKKTNDEEVKTGDVKSPKDTKEKVEKKSVKDKVKEKINKVDPKDEKIKELEEQLKQAKNDRARAYADAENMKKRLQKEADNGNQLEDGPNLDSIFNDNEDDNGGNNLRGSTFPTQKQGKPEIFN